METAQIEAKLLKKTNVPDLIGHIGLCIIFVELKDSGQKYQKRWNGYG